MFQIPRLYIQFYRNRVTVVNLNTGDRISVEALQPFSSVRQTISSFANAEATIMEALKRLPRKRSVMGLQILVQQMEGIDGGLSDIEKRAMRDLAEQAGARKVYLVEHDNPLSTEQALQLFKESK